MLSQTWLLLGWGVTVTKLGLWPLRFVSNLKDAELEAKQPLKAVDIDTILDAQRMQQEERGREKKKKQYLLRRKGINPLEHEDSFT